MKLASGLLGLTSFAAAGATEQWLVNTWWEKAVEVFQFTESNWGDFSSAVNAQPQSFFEPAWNFCNENGDDVISIPEFKSCGKRISEYLGTSNSGFDQGAGIVAKYWYYVDQDESNDLSWDEWRYAQSAFAAIDSLVVLEAFDADENGLMDSAELRAWRLAMQEMLSEYGWQPNAEHVAAVTAAWAQSQTDDDPFSASMVELARFTMLMWNAFLQ
ncbi:Oidioi.mRNA.OKI2018_I69.chr2.g4963.t1.cds [Oikopleura dioica]|uniref:Oidioi.mRNA.OKI2018_I69.chr2.g4963.t1.cds n=1 Tax=Oikopleura dioica TaxID=34765 RepID=A0ABN7T4J6_OIKDI|nr:Oidioi.mRNA.OKI2018_I69.chr2.g4963.t1.cds [Oikopleura dioica]